jgi:2-oxoglutarate ferredoxin oxidoreductase subunit alpha
METFYRYLDVDGDGIPARTLPGVDPKGAYFTRGSGHDRFGRYTEDGDLYKDVVDRIARKIEGAAEALPAPEVRLVDKATVGLVTVGGCRAAVLEALELLAEEGIALDFLRVTGFPFSDAVEEFLLSHDMNIVIEQNRDAQFKRLLLLETAVPKSKLDSVLDYRGAPLSADVVTQGVRDRLGLVPVAVG